MTIDPIKYRQDLQDGLDHLLGKGMVEVPVFRDVNSKSDDGLWSFSFSLWDHNDFKCKVSYVLRIKGEIMEQVLDLYVCTFNYRDGMMDLTDTSPNNIQRIIDHKLNKKIKNGLGGLLDL